MIKEYGIDKERLHAMDINYDFCSSFDLQNLIEMSDHEDADIRESVADDPRTPDYLLEKLSTDKDSMVRWGVVQNENTPKNILFQLMNDENEAIREAAKFHYTK